MHEFDFAGATYRIGDLTPMQEFHCVRRVAPILAAMGIGIADLKSAASSVDMLALVGKPVLDVVARMSNEDVEYVVDTCMSVVSRKIAEGKFGPIQVGGRMQYQDINMPAMIRLSIEVLKGRVGDFFAPPTEGTSTS